MVALDDGAISGMGKEMDILSEPGNSMRGVSGKTGVLNAAPDKAPVGDKLPQFALNVDSEHKAVTLAVWSFAHPHMTAFHCSWLSFFTTFASTFAAAPMIPIIRDDIDMTIADIGNAGVAAVTGTIFCRLIMGTFCDTFGPRLGFAFLMLGVAPAVFCMALVETPIGFLLCRFFIGFSLATFVACQFWASVMFTPKIVGLANATAGGWGNLGGGVTQFLIPAMFTACAVANEDFSAWRMAFFLPGCMHMVMGIACLALGQDLPDGQYAMLKKTGQMDKPNGALTIQVGASNYRAWVLTLTYGFCFGVELTMNNIAASYFFDQFDLDIKLAGLLASLFGMMNLFARSLGGYISDYSAQRYGMRGRLWALWAMQTFEGGLCILMGLAKDSLGLTLVIMVMFSTFVQASEGATFGIVPFISKRSLGVVSGMVGAGGNAGSAITQSIFFKSDKYATHEGILLMGIMIIAITSMVFLIHFPMWGGMLRPGDGTTTEEDYYTSSYTEEEKAKGMDGVAKRFAAATTGERGPAVPPPQSQV
mmetsp:Transcript_29028/g.40086  ORF Transcript_29028/g.40086 Transcript_29028/m.40086 type:complete len:534 (+) Transcript_29028:106-1707(+)|eukprot:CAMPEP_0196585020 /NCGR_PEP_ID=MMETSP1081-20130531/49334_1 /TAXON_ID=36882 /ORGANISM="Pyramimonas amylifera, Strain CCMP720" /LENGTH=533 /DNA_ID=CAMNT_0041906429 /DNA_START=99 /DNA_END=1700 /DNA_ORIENTATION=-